MRAPGELTQPGCASTLWPIVYLGFRVAVLLLAAHFSHVAAAHPHNQLIPSFRAETSPAKAGLATSGSADTPGKAAPAPGASLKSGQKAQPGRPVDTSPCYNNNSQDNIQWKLFVFGLVLFLPSCIGAVLPLCSRPRFPTRGHKCAHRPEALS